MGRRFWCKWDTPQTTRAVFWLPPLKGKVLPSFCGRSILWRFDQFARNACGRETATLGKGTQAWSICGGHAPHPGPRQTAVSTEVAPILLTFEDAGPPFYRILPPPPGPCFTSVSELLSCIRRRKCLTRAQAPRPQSFLRRQASGWTTGPGKPPTALTQSFPFRNEWLAPCPSAGPSRLDGWFCLHSALFSKASLPTLISGCTWMLA